MPDLMTALENVETALAARDGAAAMTALQGLTALMPDRWIADDLRRFFHTTNAVYSALPELGLDDAGQRRLRWYLCYSVEHILTDRHGRSRRFQQGSSNRRLALGWDPADYGTPEPALLVHIPLEEAEARDLLAPFLGLYEQDMDAQPYAHFKLCWEAKAHPVAPFDVILDDWLRDMDARGLGLPGSHPALQRAFALAKLAEEGRQKTNWKSCEAEILPLLQDPNMMLAAAAGKFLGMVVEEPDAHINGPKPPALPEIMTRIAALPKSRRAAAGGFLNGIAGDGMDPFVELKDRSDMAEFDTDEWVLQVFADNVHEPYTPGAQAFWFYVHEYYWNAPDFIMTLIDKGHIWEAFMCATEAPSLENGMGPVLQRLARVADGDIAEGAHNCLTRISAET